MTVLIQGVMQDFEVEGNRTVLIRDYLCSN